MENWTESMILKNWVIEKNWWMGEWKSPNQQIIQFLSMPWDHQFTKFLKSKVLGHDDVMTLRLSDANHQIIQSPISSKSPNSQAVAAPSYGAPLHVFGEITTVYFQPSPRHPREFSHFSLAPFFHWTNGPGNFPIGPFGSMVQWEDGRKGSGVFSWPSWTHSMMRDHRISLN